MLQKHFTDEQIKILKAFLPQQQGIEPLLFELLMITGCRTDEVCRVRIQDIQWKTETITIYHGSKGSNSRSAPVNRSFCERLLKIAHLEGLKPDQPLVSVLSSKSMSAVKRSLQRTWERFRFRAFGEGCTLGLHSFRHTFAKKVYEHSDKDLIATQLGLGHKSITSTQHYLKHIHYDQFRNLYKTAI